MKRALLIAALVATGVGSVMASHAAGASVPVCPGHAPKLTPRGAALRHFVRPGATEMLLCRYYGVNWGDSQGLRQQRLIRGTVTIGGITHKMLDLYVSERVKQLTGGKQSPVTQAPGGVPDFPLAVLR